MKIMIIGSGGREHALTWALKQSPQVTRIFSATGNAGIRQASTPVDLAGQDPDSIADFAVGAGVDLVVIGPEQPLVDGLADRLAARGIAAFGPARAAARLEGSKVFAKEFMARHRIPTADYSMVATPEEARQAIDSGRFSYPVVIKAEGLAAGKGVIIAEDSAQAHQAIQDLMVERTLGPAGNRLVIEECLVGRELSYLVFSDGENYFPMPVAQDHKRAYDGDRGPNTGGMGAYSTDGLLDPTLEQTIRRLIVEPTLEATRAEGFPFRGVLYCGLMLTPAGPKVLEYNVRFGDPETQAILRRLDSDFAELAWAVANGNLPSVVPRWSPEPSTCIVLASQGYPGDYQVGKTIHGIEAAENVPGVVVFQAGTKVAANGAVETAGGRVLGVTARAQTLELATSLAYRAVEQIQFDGMRYRRDIGR